jgi:PadR family transcriptional regulator PadR
MAQERYSIKQTTLYSALNRLARLEYVMPYDGVESFGRPRMYYKVTEKGKAYYLSQKALWFEVVDIMDCFVRGESDEDD